MNVFGMLFQEHAKESDRENARSLARNSYRFLFTHKNNDFGVISVTDPQRSCSAPIA
ncbi:unnamed protein product [Porites lobata]|uniref:Uncharacterized protein n=1 Tax=Porites lobata TaxID=104759 RepID=A0ABN8N0U3_9CNID|nr:unnamed protein product [Porites lobata]